MKKISSAFAVLLCIVCNAQGINTSSGNSVWKLEAGYTTFRPYQLNNFLTAAGSSAPFTSLETYGIAWGGGLVVGNRSDDGTFDGAYALHFFRPQVCVVKPDSLKYQIGGWELMTSIYGFDVLSGIQNVDLVVAPGVFWGSMRLRKEDSAGDKLFKNPFVAPMLRADLRFMIGPVAIGGRFSYRYDITNGKWKKATDENLPAYKSRELQYMVYIGWRLRS